MPARAHLAFPCFDQPDLKARWTLTPGRAGRLGGARQRRRDARAACSDGRTAADVRRDAAALHLPLRVRRRPVLRRDGGARRPHLPHAAPRDRRREGRAQPRRDLRSARRRRSHGSSATPASPYPWGKFDFLLVPSFQFGGMEHPGAIFYNASGLLLDPSATQNQKLGRASVIAHETAHMWFGDLVTMRWFNDVWMKEVFANFMAAKIVNPSFPEINHELRFLLAHYPAAVRHRSHAGHQRDPPAARQPERGRLALRRDHLSEGADRHAPARDDARRGRRSETACASTCSAHRFGNATWPDLIARARRAHARRSRGVEPRLGRRSRAGRSSAPICEIDERPDRQPGVRPARSRSRGAG